MTYTSRGLWAFDGSSKVHYRHSHTLTPTATDSWALVPWSRTLRHMGGLSGNRTCSLPIIGGPLYGKMLKTARTQFS